MEEINTNTQIVEVDHTPKFEISLEANKERLNQMQRFINEQMVKGIDYAPIPNTNGKDVLLKPGAEKLCAIYGFRPKFEKIQEILDKDTPWFFYEYKCILISKRTGIPQAEGIGSCNTKEKSKASQDPYTLLNTINKIAQKRAYVAATLMATALSQNFTQDLEDEPQEEQPKVVYGKKDTTKDSFGATYTCCSCGIEISEKVAKFSAEKYGKMLCFNHQKDEKPLN